MSATETQIDVGTLEAGRELDALISRDVMGYVTESVGGDYRYYDDHMSHERGGKWTSPVPAYSTDMAAAMQVLDVLQQRGLYVRINTTCDKGLYDLEVFAEDLRTSLACQVFTRLPLAICRAALKVVESK